MIRLAGLILVGLALSAIWYALIWALLTLAFG